MATVIHLPLFLLTLVFKMLHSLDIGIIDWLVSVVFFIRNLHVGRDLSVTNILGLLQDQVRLY